MVSGENYEVMQVVNSVYAVNTKKTQQDLQL